MCITKCDKLLLQGASGIARHDRLLIQSPAGITKSGSYYKVRRNKWSNIIIMFEMLFMFCHLGRKCLHSRNPVWKSCVSFSKSRDLTMMAPSVPFTLVQLRLV